jgi:hypothetical protein
MEPPVSIHRGGSVRQAKRLSAARTLGGARLPVKLAIRACSIEQDIRSPTDL